MPFLLIAQILNQILQSLGFPSPTLPSNQYPLIPLRLLEVIFRQPGNLINMRQTTPSLLMPLFPPILLIPPNAFLPIQLQPPERIHRHQRTAQIRINKFLIEVTIPQCHENLRLVEYIHLDEVVLEGVVGGGVAWEESGWGGFYGGFGGGGEDLDEGRGLDFEDGTRGVGEGRTGSEPVGGAGGRPGDLPLLCVHQLYN